MTVPSLSDQEVKLLGDLIEEAARATSFLGPMDAADLYDDEKTRYAVKAAVQNVTEACVQIDGGRKGARFAELFEGFELAPLRRMGNAFRHDYGALNPTVLFNDATRTVPRLAARAEELLADHRRLRGADPNRLQD